MYYLLEKRLKQGLNFPDVDFAFDDNDVNVEMLSNKKSNNSYTNNVNMNNGISTLTKHNSQLLPKRNTAKDNSINRTTSQKNVDFKFIYNNMNNYPKNNENDMSNGNNINGRPESAMSSNSPSPDFSLAINPIRTTATSSNGTNQNVIAQKNSRSNYHDIVYRKSNNNNSSLNTQIPVSTNTNNNSNTDHNKVSSNAHNYQNSERGVTTASSNVSRTDRYFVAMSMNNTVQTPPNEELNKNRNIISNNNQTNGIRSLPGKRA